MKLKKYLRTAISAMTTMLLFTGLCSCDADDSDGKNNSVITLTVETYYSGWGGAGQDLGSGNFTEKFTVEEGDCFEESSGHFKKSSETSQSKSTIIIVNDISDDEISFSSFKDNDEEKHNTNYDTKIKIPARYVVYDDTNYEYTLTFEKTN